jgi:hypothetical protein
MSAHAAPEIRLSGTIAPVDAMMMLPVGFIASEEQSPATLMLRLTHDPEKMTLIDVIAGTAILSAAKTLDYAVDETRIAVAVFGGADSIPTGTLFHFLFRLTAEALPGDILFVLSEDTHGADADAQRVVVQINSANIRVQPDMERHSADLSADWSISLEELLRVIQFYSVGGYHCDMSEGDGFAPGDGNRTCDYHDSDYAPQDWRISFTELLRAIQLYNGPQGMYHAASTGEDGFAPGPFGYKP